MKDTELSKFFGVCISYFHQVKLNNKEKYDLMFSFDSNAKISVLKYISYVKSVLNKMEVVLFDYEDGSYGKFLFDNKIINHTNFKAIYDNEVSIIFAIRDNDRDFLSINLKQIEKWEKIIDIYNAK